jgi:hypothetical protein
MALPLGAAALCYGDTFYVLPTTRTVALPTSYVVGSSYLLPTTYVTPSYSATAYYATNYYPTTWYSTAYYPTTYYPRTYYYGDAVSLTPTAYFANVYERRGLFGRRRWLVEQPLVAAYVPTTYYAPTYYSTRTYVPTVYQDATAWESEYVAAAPSICDELVAAAPTRTAPSSIATRSGASTGSRRVESEVMEPVIDSAVPPLPNEPGAVPRSPTPAPADKAAKKSVQSVPGAADTPPNPPKPLGAADDASRARDETRDAAKSSAGGANRNAGTPDGGENPAAKKPVAPQVPAGQNDVDIEPAPGANAPGAVRREAMRPAYAARPLAAALRNVLNGRVESESGQPREEVRVTISNSADNRIFHEGITDAFGAFAIRLSSGEWTVKVTMPSGRVYPVRQITVREGRILDNREGRVIPNLIIWY